MESGVGFKPTMIKRFADVPFRSLRHPLILVHFFFMFTELEQIIFHEHVKLMIHINSLMSYPKINSNPDGTRTRNLHGENVTTNQIRPQGHIIVEQMRLELTFST